MNLKDFINIYTVAGAGAGMYAGHAKYGKKHGYKAVAGGAVAGVIAGLIVEKLVAPKQPTQAQIAAAAQQQQIAQQQAQAAAAGQGEYVDLDSDGGFGEYVQPPPRNASSAQRAEYEAQQAAFENLGSLSGADGLGSLSGTQGFDADAIDYDEVLGEDGGSDFN